MAPFVFHSLNVIGLPNKHKQLEMMEKQVTQVKKQNKEVL